MPTVFRLVLPLLAFFLLSTGTAISQGEPVPITECRVTPGDHLILLPVTLQSQVFKFGLASTATHHMFDASLRERLPQESGQVRVNRGKPDEITVSKHPSPVIRIGAVALGTEQDVLCSDFSVWRDASGEDVRGMIGLPFLKQYTIQCDFGGGIVRIFEPGVTSTSWGTVFPLATNARGEPLVHDVLVADSRESFTINTASESGATIHRWLFQRLVSDSALRLTPYDAVTVRWATPVRSRTGVVNTLRFGPFLHEQIYVGEGATNHLGLKYLARFIVTLDLANRRLYLKKGRYFNRRYPRYWCGLTVWQLNGHVIVHGIRENTPAAAVGLEKNDIIRTINGQDASTLGLRAVRRSLSASKPEPITLVVSRNGKDRDVVLDMVDVIGDARLDDGLPGIR